ncbi:RNA polymerase sigma-70 factor [Pedobacter sp. KR3-3]|uniref:RNA polymerase sigma factor n=1 Tax=Pedobacter albus TaxID=3113905 RepID=A0ABU7IB93_9SPHI|nr:RNA polymerase sigma-70 factor [Pedobacter sp. KR3-3]MEE1946434.1 RNA polymerase sigma-70 factor [Pedobacter sp. KR3-3]
MQSAGGQDEGVLLRSLRDGNELAFDQLYRLYSYQIYTNILRMVKDPDVAQELLQDVFLKVWERRSFIDPQKSFKAYLYQIARSRVFDFFRHEKIARKVESYLSGIHTELHTDLEDQLQYKETRERYDHAVSMLPEQRQKIYILCKIEGKSYSEVSNLLRISSSTIQDHMVKANKFIRAHLGEAIALLLISRL